MMSANFKSVDKCPLLIRDTEKRQKPCENGGKDLIIWTQFTDYKMYTYRKTVSASWASCWLTSLPMDRLQLWIWYAWPLWVTVLGDGGLESFPRHQNGTFVVKRERTQSPMCLRWVWDCQKNNNLKFWDSWRSSPGYADRTLQVYVTLKLPQEVWHAIFISKILFKDQGPTKGGTIIEVVLSKPIFL